MVATKKYIDRRGRGHAGDRDGQTERENTRTSTKRARRSMTHSLSLLLSSELRGNLNHTNHTLN